MTPETPLAIAPWIPALFIAAAILADAIGAVVRRVRA